MCCIGKQAALSGNRMPPSGHIGVLPHYPKHYHSAPLTGDDLMRCVDLYNQAQSKWFEEMVTSSLVSAKLKSLFSWNDSALKEPGPQT